MRILGVSGSTRKRSYNTALLEEAKGMLPEDVTLEIADISNLSLYSQDLEDQPPESVRVLKEMIRGADAVLFATPEHNFSVTAVLKNAIEWGNRPSDDNVWDGKPAAVISASGGPRGGMRSQLHLRQILVDLNMYAMNEPVLILGNASQAFDSNLRLTDERARRNLKAVLDGLVAWSARLRGNRMSNDTKYWLVVVSKDHLENGRKLGIVQANHGKAAPLKRMKPGDFVVFYSPKLHFQGKEPYKKFTAIARVKEGEVYQADMGGGFKPYRRDVKFLPCEETEIEPLIPKLMFIHNMKNWGFVFRFGFFGISEDDFETISKAMKKVLLKENADRIVVKSFVPIEDLAGVDAGKVPLEEMK